MSSKSNTIQSIEFLRFLSLLEVFLVHYLNEYSNNGIELGISIVSGRVGVAFFFLISAYLLVKTTKNGGALRLIYKKIATLLPAYEFLIIMIFIASMVAPFLFKTFDINGISLLKSMFLIPYKTKGVPFCCPILPVGWTLVVQMTVFIVYYIMFDIFKSQKKSVCGISIVIGMIMCWNYIGKTGNIITFAYGQFYMVYFLIGFIIALYDNKIKKLLYSKCFSIGKKANILVLCICTVAFLMFSCIYKENILCAVVIAMVFISCITLLEKFTFPKMILFMGKISYSFYLLHYLIVKFYLRVVCFSTNGFLIIASIVLCFIVTLILSWVYWYVFQKKIPGRLLMLIKVKPAMKSQ